jgi:3-deoxy-D-manno-octulosonate 8-phosphate phosphatase (KDO 8-P phosphatase)
VRRDVTARARRIRLLVMDVDGVLTDGRMVLSDKGDELKMFHTHDGIGLALAHRAGLKTALVTGETSPIAKARGDKLGVDTVVLGARRKGEVVEALLTQAGLPAEALAYIGDDLLDIPALQRAGLAIAVADAVPDVRALAHFVTQAPGGHGAVRECIELLLRAQGAWDAVYRAFIEDHGGQVGRTGYRRSSRSTRSPEP